MNLIYHIVGFIVVWSFILGWILIGFFYIAGKWFFKDRYSIIPQKKTVKRTKEEQELHEWMEDNPR
jgi:uncharacterized membrane protein YciS (DUF1049 family)